MTPIIVTVVLVISIALIFIACQLFCWFTEPRIILGMGRGFPAVTIAIAWLTLVAYGTGRLIGTPPHPGRVINALAASAFSFFVVGLLCSAVLLVAECVLLVECGMSSCRQPGAVWWHLGGVTSTAFSLYVLSLFG
jgi:hypothetical protein